MIQKFLLLSVAFLASLWSPLVHAQENAPTTSAKSGEYFFSFLEYRYDMHTRVIERWEKLVRANRDKLQPQTLTLHYHINPEGFISVIESRKRGSSNAMETNEHKLGAYALALENKSPTPMPALVSTEFPHGYFYQITLQVR